MTGKIYVFGIGGTGARVIKSLTMLAGAGVPMEAEAIVPIIIDPDFGNADVTRAIKQLNIYANIRELLVFNDTSKNGFFQISIEKAVNDYRLRLKDTKSKKFKEYIDLGNLSRANRALASILFSETNLESEMEVGFKGNPNMGSVVLNQFTDSEDFINFASAFNPGDRIFIISSIFGGTGASGFPLLLKNLRGLSSNMPNFAAIKQAPIGAITVLPYFDVKPDEKSSINSSTFISKSKAALKYYENNVTGNQSSVNALYYIGDLHTKQYENEEGGDKQKNNAHIIELVSALAIIDFMSISNQNTLLNCAINSEGKVYAPNPVFKEFGIENDVEEILFGNLSQKTRSMLSRPMTQFILLSKYVIEHLNDASDCVWVKDNHFDNAFMTGTFMDNLRSFTNAYLEWLTEMADNDRSFTPFKLSVKSSDLFNIVNGVKVDKIKDLWALGKSGYNLFDAGLNKRNSLPANLTSEQKFMELFYIVTKEIVNKKFRF